MKHPLDKGSQSCYLDRLETWLIKEIKETKTAVKVATAWITNTLDYDNSVVTTGNSP